MRGRGLGAGKARTKLCEAGGKCKKARKDEERMTAFTLNELSPPGAKVE
jgi:hypothetical protein